MTLVPILADNCSSSSDEVGMTRIADEVQAPAPAMAVAPALLSLLILADDWSSGSDEEGEGNLAEEWSSASGNESEGNPAMVDVVEN